MSSNAAGSEGMKKDLEDEEDLDDLDDVLDQFKVPSKPIPQVPTTVEDSKPKSTQGVVSPDDSALPPELSAELMAGMEEFFKELTMGQPPSGPPTSATQVPKTSKDFSENEATKNINLPTLSEEEKKFKEIWEKMLIDGMNGEEDSAAGKEFDEILRKAAPLLSKETDKDKGKGKEGAASAPQNKSGAKESADAKLHQEAIRQTMDRLKNSDKSIKTDATDPLGAMMSELGDLKPEDMEGMDGMLEDMLGALMSKEILYEPLKEMDSQFPEYFKSHPDIPSDERQRYESQHRAAKAIIAIFDRPGFKDDDPACGTEVLKLMTEMQSYGQPPPEIMGPLPPGFDMNGLGDGENCVIS